MNTDWYKRSLAEQSKQAPLDKQWMENRLKEERKIVGYTTPTPPRHECSLCGDAEAIYVDGHYLCPSCADLVENEELLEE